KERVRCPPGDTPPRACAGPRHGRDEGEVGARSVSAPPTTSPALRADDGASEPTITGSESVPRKAAIGDRARARPLGFALDSFPHRVAARCRSYGEAKPTRPRPPPDTGSCPSS